MRFIYTPTFEKQFSDLVSNKSTLEDKVYNIMLDFENKLFESNFYRKPLTWYKDIHELEVWWDIRIIVQFFMKDNVCYWLNIGTHATLQLGKGKKTKINPKPSTIIHKQ